MRGDRALAFLSFLTLLMTGCVTLHHTAEHRIQEGMGKLTVPLQKLNPVLKSFCEKVAQT